MAIPAAKILAAALAAGAFIALGFAAPAAALPPLSPFAPGIESGGPIVQVKSKKRRVARRAVDRRVDDKAKAQPQGTNR
jgi:hypothetical protein